MANASQGVVDQSNTHVTATLMAKKLRRMTPLGEPEQTLFPEETVVPEETVIAETFLPADDQYEGTCVDEATTVCGDWAGYVPTLNGDEDGQEEPTK